MIVPLALAAMGWEVGCLSGTPHHYHYSRSISLSLPNALRSETVPPRKQAGAASDERTKKSSAQPPGSQAGPADRPDLRQGVNPGVARGAA